MKFFKSLVLCVSMMMLVLGLSFQSLWANESEHGSQEKAQEESLEKGPNGGRVLKDGDLTLELLIFERAMEPHFRAYVYKKGEIVNPTQAKLTLTLTRFNHKNDRITFVPIDNFLQSNQVVEEPHSFDVALQLDFEGKQYAWHYSSYEGRLKMAPALLKAADIQTSQAQSRTIKTQLKVVGKIVPNRDTLTPIYARYEGIIKSMTKNLGDEVIKGDVLATIESNESLQNYSINAPMTGTIVQKSATNGELARNSKPIYEIANLANVWSDFTLYRKEAPLIKQGMEITVTGDEGKPRASSTISYIAPLGI
ncbi:MAG: HlyD family efflux transporter periplasmic adaptor subunit, partial [Legionella sp.]